MKLRATWATAGWSYVEVAVQAVVSLLTVRLATRALVPEEYGLWSFVAQTVGYLGLLDLGVSTSLGRLFGEPLASRDPERAGRWLSLAVAVLALQGVLVLLVGFACRDWVLGWFGVPLSLREEAGRLWSWAVVLQAAVFPFRVIGGVLHAQNRAYWSSVGISAGVAVGVAVFWWGLASGAGVFSYIWSLAASSVVGTGIGVAAVCAGPDAFRLGWRGIPWGEARGLLGFSSAVFVVGVSSQVFYASHALILTKLIGLEAAAVFAVTSRVPLLLMRLVWRPFDAFTPRWQVAYCGGDAGRVALEFGKMVRVSVLLAGCAAAAVMAANPAFVRWWAKPEYYGGPALNTLLAVFLFVQVFPHCFSFGFGLSKRMGGYVGVVVATTLAGVAAMVWGVGRIGLPGLVAGALAADFAFAFWYVGIGGARLLGQRFLPCAAGELGWVLPCAVGAAWVGWAEPLGGLPAGAASFLAHLAVAVCISAPLGWRLFRLAGGRPGLAGAG